MYATFTNQHSGSNSECIDTMQMEIYPTPSCASIINTELSRASLDLLPSDSTSYHDANRISFVTFSSSHTRSSLHRERVLVSGYCQ